MKKIIDDFLVGMTLAMMVLAISLLCRFAIAISN